MPPDVPLPIVDAGRSSQESVPTDTHFTTPDSVPLVDLAGSPTSKHRQISTSRSSSRQTPRRPELPPDYRPGDYQHHADPPDYHRTDPVWVPSSAPTKLTNGYRDRGGSPSNSVQMDLTPASGVRTPGQFMHSRVAALQSYGRTPVCIGLLFNV